MAGNMVSFIQSKPQVGAQNWGRYRKEFEEVEFLGKGGFGEVVKARHLQDGRAYAIKKVRLRPEDNELRVLREVNTLSGLNHINIVRYFSCWLEDVAPPVHTPPDSTSNTPGVLSPTNKDDSDPFAPPRMDDPSLWRRDASKSTSFPRIRFAETEEDEDIDEDEEEDSEGSSDTSDAETISRKTAKGLKVSEEMTSTTIDEMVIKRILYIQMEFVENQTLKEAIAAGLNDSDSWRIFNQILQALAYLSHEKSVVHRDLKPANILLDAHGNAKVSDFGLATTGLVGVETTPGETTEEISDKTSGIGTSLYIAPEVAGSRSYDTKVDMYSLGIIFFEMCYPFKTGMERIQILSALRQPSITFPDGWKPDWKSEQKEIITWLLRHDPSMRPSARQLLLSPLVPSQDKDEMFYDRAINELTNPTSQHHQTLLDALFDPDAHAYTTSYDDRPDDYTFDREQDDSLQVWLSVVIQRLEDLFKRHGAVETDLPLLMPETSLLKAFPNLKPVRLLDVKGKVVLLPFSDLLAMARSATRRQIERIKRYHIGKKYQNYPTLEGQPIVSGDVSFDIISPLRSPAADAEMLEVVDKLISEFRGVKGTSLMEYEFHISHEIVLSTILGLIPLKQRAGVQRVFKEVSPFVTPGQLRSALSGLGLTKNILDELDQCCVIAEFEAVRSKLESHFSTSSTALKLSKALEETSQVITLARSFGIARKIVFRPTLSKHAEFFRGGFMFECVRRGRQGDVVAFGGRYDCLLEHFSQSHTRQVFGVGMSIDVDQLAIMVRRYESTLSTKLMTKDNEDERSFGFWSPSRCDVYVAATAQVDLTQRLSVVGELWRAGIRADLQYDDERSVEEVLTECVDQNTLFLVLPRANRPMVKVRNVLKRSEEEIPRNELCTHLRMAIAEQRRIDATYASAEGSIPSAQAAALSVLVDTKEVVIKLVLPPEPQSSKGKSKPVRKHRHVTKGVYYDKASEFSITTQSNLPILAVDLTPSFLSQLIVDPSWITEDEIWRSFLINMNNTDKEYAGSVRKAVNEMILNNGGKSLLWLFSVREGRGFLLQPK
ncbi:PEK/GCN2 protein kinase [Tremella mesenterica]|uniref:non-specific serine/threonine protein kinase n=1 Tax=Tremella mesenterica TaxID=5217 RepID=A0A4Q1BNB9_TREME|nr:PEK/GCN2 protein kinase [Tremella mesenterica]